MTSTCLRECLPLHSFLPQIQAAAHGRAARQRGLQAAREGRGEGAAGRGRPLENEVAQHRYPFPRLEKLHDIITHASTGDFLGGPGWLVCRLVEHAL